MLRFQKEDEVDEDVRKGRETGVLFFTVAFFAAIDGIRAWIEGSSLFSYEKDLGILIGFGFLYWLLAPFYLEFRSRAKETYGKVCALEEAVIGLREQLRTIQEKFDEQVRK